ncbi:MAG: transcriptional regulator NrdR [Gaiellales bacterium]
MNCPDCGGTNSKVLESRIAEAGVAMRRRRECLDCSERYTTYERVEQPALIVVKHDGRQESFSATKLLRGLAIACSKRRIPAERLEQLAADVEAQLRATNGREFSTDQVGELALAGLVQIDETAAIRFASVIARAESLAGFRQVLDRVAAALAEGTRAVSGDGTAIDELDHAHGDEGSPVRVREAVAV